MVVVMVLLVALVFLPFYIQAIYEWKDGRNDDRTLADWPE